MGAKKYDEAKSGFNEALGLKPNEKYPKDKLAEIDAALAKELGEKELNDKYNAAISKADGALSGKDYTNAKAGYNEALGLKPNEKYPKDKLAEIEKALADIAAKDKADKELNEKYTAAIAKADKALADKKYPDAKSGYTEALGLKKDEQYPKDKLAEIDAAIAKELGDKKLEENYKAAIAKGDKALSSKDYENAKAGYNEALGLKSAEQYPKDKLAEIDKAMGDAAAEKDRLAKEKELEEKYKAAITKGDAALGTKKYDEAKAGYNEALGLKPNEKYPKDKLAEIDAALAKELGEKELNDKYNAAISKADGALSGKDYTNAKAGYNEALGLKPNEKYPKDKLAEIEKVLADIAAKDKADKELNEKYTAAIAKADKALADKKYPEAKSGYTEALGLKKDEQYPKDKLAEIDKLLAGDAAEKDRLAKEKETEEKYKAAIAKGDAALNSKIYDAAKTEYTTASGLKPTEQYPKEKLAEIEKILADISKAGELESNYKSAISKGDASFNSKEYQTAKVSYTEASNLKPSEKYPKDQLAKIEVFIAEQNKDKESKERYDAAIAKADGLFSSKDYPGAISGYKEAQAIKPNEVYPASKISECNKLMDDEARSKDKEQKYSATIANADKLFDAKEYRKSKDAYTSASLLKPSEQHPKDRIIEIDAILKKKANEVIVPSNNKKDNGPNEIALKYGEGIFEEYDKDGKNSIVRRIVVKGNEGHIYTQKTTGFGSVFWYKDNVQITEQEFIKNTEQ